MIRSMQSVRGLRLQGKDGEMGEVDDFLFDEELWAIRYLVADTGGWLSGRKVLIPSDLLSDPDWDGRVMPVKLTLQQIEESPPLESDEPVSRKLETKILEYFGLQPYWTAGIPTGLYPIPMTSRNRGQWPEEKRDERPADPGTTLRSYDEVTGYHLLATDGELGHAADFLFDDENWAIRHMVVDTRNWLRGQRVIIPLVWIKDISWEKQSVIVDVKQQDVKDSPKFEPSAPINREQEDKLFDYYGRPHYNYLAQSSR